MDNDDIEKKHIATSSGGGYTPLVKEEVSPKTQTLVETLKQLAERQRLARKEELTYSKEDEARWAVNRQRVIGTAKKNLKCLISILMKYWRTLNWMRLSLLSLILPQCLLMILRN